MGTWLLAVALVGATALAQSGVDERRLPPPCKRIAVSLVVETPRVRAGSRPQFSVAVKNNSDRLVRLLDLRHGRRVDLQNFYVELQVTSGTKPVDVGIAISDPGPFSESDVLGLAPGELVEFRRISYTLSLEELPRGAYEAFVLFWRDPMQSHTTRCRSTSTRFTVQ